ncbi:hypothetical protein [Helicobacter bizzozeronii]|uniref:hypothetical protein n=1 Tax=Helicobacter bizzozeronii TaxID=56877 RepID=UPI000CF02446|nr:hypothetical protein [Helicobacter bizzozeronii]
MFRVWFIGGGGGGGYQNHKSLKRVKERVKNFLKESKKARPHVQVRAPLGDLQGGFGGGVGTANFLKFFKNYIPASL